MKYLLILIICFSVFGKSRRVSIIASEEGYYPSVIHAKQGEKLSLFFTATTQKKSCALVEDHKIILSAKKGELAFKQIHLYKAGEYKIYCPGSKYEGKLLISDEHNRVIRTTASEKPSYWVPKELMKYERVNE